MTFGGSPERAEICIYLNAAAGLYQDCEIFCYPIDKDTKSPNYLNTRELYENYRDFRKTVEGSGLELTNIRRSESMFEEMLSEAGLDAQEESLKYIVAKLEIASEQNQRLMDVCLTSDEQNRNMEGGYYGKANIGSATGNILKYKNIYQKEELYRNIQGNLKAGNEVDVVIICSSFGGTGASLGINFGKFLRRSMQNEDNFHLHCIHIQPYFCFPDPDENEVQQMDYKLFREKSATVISALAEEPKFIMKDEEKALFDRFYYIGQLSLDKVSDVNSAVGNQENRIHMVDMLVSLAVQDILLKKEKEGQQLYAYQYAAKGTEKISWNHMPGEVGFEKKHVQMMRFCEFMLDCIETLFDDEFTEYKTQRLIMYLYGRRGFKSEAGIDSDVDQKLRAGIKKGVAFCRKYVHYWIELEETTRNGKMSGRATSFFDLDELKRIAEPKGTKDFNYRLKRVNNLDLCKMINVRKYTAMELYDKLRVRDELYHIAKHKEKNVAGILMYCIYEMSSVDYE